MKERKLIDYDKLIAFLEEKKEFYSMMACEQLEKGGPFYLTYTNDELLIENIISEIKCIPF